MKVNSIHRLQLQLYLRPNKHINYYFKIFFCKENSIRELIHFLIFLSKINFHHSPIRNDLKIEIFSLFNFIGKN